MQVRDDRFIFLAESDYMVAQDMYAKLKTGVHARILQGMRNESRRGQRRAMLLSAFERLADVPSDRSSKTKCAASFDVVQPEDTCFMYDTYDVPVTKGSLRRMVKDGRASVFHEKQVRLHPTMARKAALRRVPHCTAAVSMPAIREALGRREQHAGPAERLHPCSSSAATGATTRASS